ncbi:MAG: NAD-dependent epimerase/dehydratase family protein, partial [Nitrospirae bacterium]
KVTRGVAAIVAKRADKVFLGNLDAKRDWGYAPEYVECMWKILQAERPDDFVIGTGEMHTVRELVEAAFSYAGLDWKKHVELDRRYLRPLEVDGLQADASKARTRLGWTPRVRFTDLVKIMVDCDLELMGCRPVGEGKKILKSAGLDWTTNRMTVG